MPVNSLKRIKQSDVYKVKQITNNFYIYAFILFVCVYVRR